MDFAREKETTLFRIMSLIVIDCLEVDKTLISFDSTFYEDLGADSLDLYELLYQFETNLSVVISDEVALDVFKTIGSLYQYLQKECTWINNQKTAEDYVKMGKALSGIYFALLNYEKALEIDQNCINALISRAELYQEKEKYEKAINDYSKILEISSDYPNKDYKALSERAITYYRMGKYKKAAKDYEEAFKMSVEILETPEMKDLIEKGFIISK